MTLAACSRHMDATKWNVEALNAEVVGDEVSRGLQKFTHNFPVRRSGRHKFSSEVGRPHRAVA
jgi:hypothetical protein